MLNQNKYPNYDYKDEEAENFSDKLDIYKYVSEIKLRLKKDITADFVLAKLGDKDKEGIIELGGDAYFCKKLVTMMERRAKKCIWNNEREKWEIKRISRREKQTIKKISEGIFDSFMTRIYLTVILNRNVDRNYLINILSNYKEEEEEITPEEAKEQIKNLLSNEEKKKKEK